jgi:hypothetical protein
LFDADFFVQSHLMSPIGLDFSSRCIKGLDATLSRCALAQKCAKKAPAALPDPIRFDDLTIDISSDRLNDRAMWRISWITQISALTVCMNALTPFDPAAIGRWNLCYTSKTQLCYPSSCL